MSLRYVAVMLGLCAVASTAAGQHHHATHEHHESHGTHAQDHSANEHAAHGAHRQADAPTPSEQAHVPPAPPTLVLDSISKARMIELMQMDDNAIHWLIDLNEFEAFEVDDHTAVGWEASAWIGTDKHKLVLKSEGEHVDGETLIRNEALWDRIVSRWWSLQAGVRHDSLAGPSRTWAAIGVQGLAPYFIEVDATFYVGESGRTALRIGAHTDWLLTQRLVLQPQFEVNAYGKDDRQNAIGAGIADLELGLRLRYEIIREFAPYIGVQWERAFGDTAQWRQAAGHEKSDVAFVAGIKAWF